MKYPKQYALGNHQEEVRVGDLVWFNEGSCVGFVAEVMEEQSDYERWGLDEPSIAYAHLHPFEANGKKQSHHIGFATSAGTVVYPLDLLEDEGVGLLSEHERSELDWATAYARSRVAITHRDLPFCVSALMDSERRQEDWHFHFVDGECQLVESVVFPFRPNTRTKGEQVGAGQPATRPVDEPEGGDKPQPEAEGRSR